MSHLQLVVRAASIAAFLVPAGALADETVDRAKADAAAQNIFNSTCAWCHHNGGRSGGGIGPKLMGNDKSDEFIINRIKNGKPDRMPAFGGLGDAEIEALLRYIRNLKPED
jgi:mono/diheme cytochrome c family protein